MASRGANPELLIGKQSHYTMFSSRGLVCDATQNLDASPSERLSNKSLIYTCIFLHGGIESEIKCTMT